MGHHLARLVFSDRERGLRVWKVQLDYSHRRHGFDGHLWHGRFKSPAIRAERYLLRCGCHVEPVPVRHGREELGNSLDVVRGTVPLT
jgi:hypothetical protein